MQVSEFRAEVRAQFSASREDSQARYSALREETQAKYSELREELHAGLESVRIRLVAVEAVLPHLATKADVIAVRGELHRVEGTLATAIANLQASMIKWIVGSAISGMAVAVAVAKFLG